MQRFGGICLGGAWNAQAVRRSGAWRTAGGDHFASQIGTSRHGRLRFTNGAHEVAISADPHTRNLYIARFPHPTPTVGVRDGVVSLRYPRACHRFGCWPGGLAEVALSTHVPWTIDARGGVSRLTADLRGLRLESLSLHGGAGRVEVSLPEPAGTLDVVVLGGASNVSIRCSEGAAVRLRVEGGATNVNLGERRIGVAGDDLDLRSPGYDGATYRYSVRVTGGANNVSVGEQTQVRGGARPTWT